MPDSMQTPGTPENNKNLIVISESKSPILAFILILVAGPLGFLYVSIIGGIALIITYGIFFILTLGFGAVILAILNIVLAFIGYLMAGAQNRRSVERFKV